MKVTTKHPRHGFKMPSCNMTWKGGGEEVGYFQISWFKSKAIVLYENFQWGWGGATFVTEIQSMRTLKLIPPLASVNLNSRSLSHDRICQPKYVCSSTICPPSPLFWNNIARAFPVTRFRSQDGCTTMYDVLAILRDSERTCGKVEF